MRRIEYFVDQLRVLAAEQSFGRNHSSGRSERFTAIVDQLELCFSLEQPDDELERGLQNLRQAFDGALVHCTLYARDPNLRKCARRVFETPRSHDVATDELLRALLKDMASPDVEICLGAVDAVGRLALELRREGAIKAIDGHSSHSLGQHHALVRELMGHESGDIRASCVVALGKMGDASARKYFPLLMRATIAAFLRAPSLTALSLDRLHSRLADVSSDARYLELAWYDDGTTRRPSQRSQARQQVQGQPNANWMGVLILRAETRLRKAIRTTARADLPTYPGATP